MTQLKQFDQQLYNENDPAKYLIIKWLKDNDYNAIANPSKAGIAVLAKKDNINYYIEVEVKHNWDKYEFPFDTIDIAGRRDKIFKPKRIESTYLFMLNSKRERFLILSAKDMLMNSQRINKTTKYTPNGEVFIRVPASAAKYIDLQKQLTFTDAGLDIPNDIFRH